MSQIFTNIILFENLDVLGFMAVHLFVLRDMKYCSFSVSMHIHSTHTHTHSTILRPYHSFNTFLRDVMLTKLEECNSYRKKVSTCVLCILNTPSWQKKKKYASYINYANVTISIVHTRVAIDRRLCKNISLSYQHKIYSLTCTYLPHYSQKKRKNCNPMNVLSTSITTIITKMHSF
jgi:hypothetical protein